jgi:hypothetical protein
MNQQESVFVAMRQQIASTPMPVAQPATRRPRVTSRIRVALGGAGAVGASVAVALVAGVFATTPPAFAVTTTPRGISIELHDFGALDALNARLTAKGIALQVVPAVPGCTATAQVVDPGGAPGAPETLAAHHARQPVGSIGIGNLREPPSGDTFIVGISSDSRWLMLFPREIHGALPSCVGEQPPGAATSLRPH